MVICAPPFMVALVVPVAILWTIFSPLGPTRILASVVSPVMAFGVVFPVSVVISHCDEYGRKLSVVVVLRPRGLR